MPSVWYGRISTRSIIRYFPFPKCPHRALMSFSSSLMPGTSTYLSQNGFPCVSSQSAVSSVLVLVRPVSPRCLSGLNCFTSSNTRSAMLKSSSTWLFHIPPLESMQTCIPFSCSMRTRGTSASAWAEGSPPENVTPPRFPKNGFWFNAIFNISPGSVGVPPSNGIVSGFAQYRHLNGQPCKKTTSRSPGPS